MISSQVTLRSAPSRTRSGVRWRRQCLYAACLVVIAAAIVARRPDAVLHPQFYAEDGASWFADVHNTGALHSLLLPLAGYYLFFQRVVAALFEPIGIDRVPGAFALIGLLCQLLPAAYFMSGRMRSVVTSDVARVGLAALYVTVPIPEVGGNLTNTQWDLAILAMLVVVAPTPTSRTGKAIDLTILTVSGLTGPYVLFLLPIAALRWRSQLTRWRALELATLGACAALQLAVIIYLHAHAITRTPRALGSPDLLGLIVTNQIMKTVGTSLFSSEAELLALMIATAFVLFLVIVARRGPSSLRAFILFGALLALSGALSPYGPSDSRSPWQQLADGGGRRYFYVLMLAAVFSVAWLAFSSSKRMTRVAALSVLTAFCAVSLTHWEYPPYYEPQVVRYSEVLGSAPKGAEVTMPILPNGWSMTLVNR